ncbi:NAD(P)H-hydrate dehydratase [Aurantiacibacter sp. MUD11]|uniref:NAD(P)H-hydrate dehydratase n=1 Tax=Aurantiacibacter sp. MUD11 TaxID=3003265 RepID=UPI0022AB19C6|nr:NAD(P)H-hydrate dehydratase [Aurantiacibacter sp. MUD11]WAT18512.1 NAD(P)H-hydrate dehydratase [Aurantiacibacter sp. MUD11]
MAAAPHQILTAAQMQEAEQALIAAGDSVETLMERAGAGAADWVWRMAAGRPVTVLCGPGNNGGDGYVIARVLSERGLKVQVVAPLEPSTDAAKTARRKWGGEPVSHAQGSVFVDCLFGTGLGRPLGDDLLAHLRTLADAHELRVATDLPSGIDSDNGEALNEGLPSYHLTVSLGAWKHAHWLMPAMAKMGERRLVDIGVSKVHGAARLSTPPRLSAPTPDAHKYSRGLLAVIAGQMPGAAILAARAAQHGGAGYVKIFLDEEDDPIDAPADLVVERGSLFQLVRDHRIDAFLIGPGLGRSEAAQSRLDWVLACDVPTVVDADALTLLEPPMLEDREWPIIATPHAGELETMARAFDAVGLDRMEQATELAEGIEGVLVAKGPDTLIAAQGASLAIMPPATSWLSTAGTGDVLAGLIASRLASGASPRKAAEQGCWLHSLAAGNCGPVFTAGQLIEAIPAAYAQLL